MVPIFLTPVTTGPSSPSESGTANLISTLGNPISKKYPKERCRLHVCYARDYVLREQVLSFLQAYPKPYHLRSNESHKETMIIEFDSTKAAEDVQITLSSLHPKISTSLHEDVVKDFKNVYIVNLPPTNYFETDLRNIFSQYGEIHSLKICRKPERPATGFVRFYSFEDARRAILQINNGTVIQNTYRVQCRYAYKSVKVTGTPGPDSTTTPPPMIAANSDTAAAVNYSCNTTNHSINSQMQEVFLPVTTPQVNNYQTVSDLHHYVSPYTAASTIAPNMTHHHYQLSSQPSTPPQLFYTTNCYPAAAAYPSSSTGFDTPPLFYPTNNNNNGLCQPCNTPANLSPSRVLPADGATTAAVPAAPHHPHYQISAGPTGFPSSPSFYLVPAAAANNNVNGSAPPYLGGGANYGHPTGVCNC